MGSIKNLFEINGEKVFVTIEETSWNYIVVSFKVSKRKGQIVEASFRDDIKIIDAWVDNYDSYAAIRFATKIGLHTSRRECISYCSTLIESINKYINFNSDMKFITSELLAIL